MLTGSRVVRCDPAAELPQRSRRSGAWPTRTSVRRLSSIPLPYVAALFLAGLLGGGIYALRGSGAPSPTSSQAAPVAHSSTPVHSTTANAIGAPRPNGEASRSATQILADAASALRAARGFELQGAQIQGGQTLRVPKGFYVRANASFRTQQLGGRGAVLADRWIQTSSSALSSELAHFAPATMARCLTEDHGTLSIGGTTSVNGEPAIVIRDAGDLPGTQPGTLAVATTGPPYPLRLNAAGHQRAGGQIDVCNDGHSSGYQAGTLTFSRFSQIPPLPPPTDPIQTPSPPVS
jgi:hypothetical protein